MKKRREKVTTSIVAVGPKPTRITVSFQIQSNIQKPIKDILEIIKINIILSYTLFFSANK